MLTFHHTGIAVKSIAESVKIYNQIFGKENISTVYNISSQKVNVCFVKISHESYLELVEPSGPGSTIYNLIEKGTTYYHIGYKVKNIEEAIEYLQGKGFLCLSRFKSEAFNNNNCAFLFSRDMHLFELIES